MSFTDATDALTLMVEKLRARSSLTGSEAQALLDLPIAQRRVAAHYEIVGLGEQSGHSCLVASGLIARYVQLADGRRQHVSLHIPGDMPDIASLMLPTVPVPLMALAPSLIVLIPHAALNQAISRFPAIGAALWRECVIDGNIMAQWLASVGRRDARGRIAHLLCEMAVRSHQIGRLRQGAFPFEATQEQISDAIGLTSVHVNRSLQALRADRLIQLSRSEAVILDWDRLAYVGDFDPTYLQLPSWNGQLVEQAWSLRFAEATDIRPLTLLPGKRTDSSLDDGGKRSRGESEDPAFGAGSTQ